MGVLAIPRPQTPISRQPAPDGGAFVDQDWYRFFNSLRLVFGANGTILPSAGGTGVPNADSATITLSGPYVVSTHGGTVSFPTAGTTMTFPAASKTLMATDFSNSPGAGGDLSGTYPSPTVTATHLASPLPASQGGTGNTSGAPGGTAGGDLSGSFPNPTVAKVNGATLGTMTATAGNIPIGSGSAWVTKAITGDITLASTGAVVVTKINGNALGDTTPTAGNTLVADGSTWKSTPSAHGANSLIGATPIGSASATGVMMGIAASLTPAATGKVVILATGTAQHSNSGGSFNYQIRFGTGAAPANGAALTGTAQGDKMGGQTAAANQKLPFSIATLGTFTVGTTYWFDLSLDNGGGGTATIVITDVVIFEL